MQAPSQITLIACSGKTILRLMTDIASVIIYAKKFRLVTLVSLFFGFALIQPAYSATVEVTVDSDVSTVSECTLRDAISSINLASLQGGCLNSGSGFGNQDLVEFDLAVPFTVTLEGGALMVSQDMTIRSGAFGLAGAEQAIIRSEEGLSNRIFHITNARVVIQNFTISHGFIESLIYPTAPEIGGGVYATSGTELRVMNSIIQNNRADIGGGIGLDEDSNVTISNSRISQNNAVAGAGVGAINSSDVYLLSDTHIEQNHADSIGGGIGLNENSLLRMRNSIINGNQAFVDPDDYTGMGTVYPDGTEGGGISASNNSRVEILDDSTISENTALLGGGVHISESSLLVENGLLVDNVSNGVNSVFNDIVTYKRGPGGAIYLDRGTAEIRDSEAITNSARFGGGIFASGDNATLILQRSTLASNISQNFGGGVYLYDNAISIIMNSTVSNNFTGASAQVGVFPAGGGLYAFNAGSTQIINSTFAHNTAQNGTGGGIYMNNTNMHLLNSLLTGNSSSIGADFTDADGSLSPSSSGNLVGDSEKTFDQSMSFPFFLLFPTGGDIIASSTDRSGADNPNSLPVEAIILPLEDNGGLTRTHNLATKSPALDAGQSIFCSAYNIDLDQRGKSRDDGHCDIGSVEVDQTSCYVIKAQNGNVITFCL